MHCRYTGYQSALSHLQAFYISYFFLFLDTHTSSALRKVATRPCPTKILIPNWSRSRCETPKLRSRVGVDNEAVRVSYSKTETSLDYPPQLSASMTNSSESSPLIQASNYGSSDAASDVVAEPANVGGVRLARKIVWGILTLVFVGTLPALLFFQDLLVDSFWPWLGLLPRDPALATLVILDRAPVIVRPTHRNSCSTMALKFHLSI